MAARKVRSPLVTGTTSAPSRRIRSTFSAWRSQSISPMYTRHGRPIRAQAAAAATPCCPAPVSATTRVAPSIFASIAWPSALLILWAPVCARSSRFSQTSAPHAADSRGANVSAVGRPTQSRNSAPRHAWNSAECRCFATPACSRSSAGTRVSGTNRPPHGPKRPRASGRRPSSSASSCAAASSTRIAVLFIVRAPSNFFHPARRGHEGRDQRRVLAARR